MGKYRNFEIIALTICATFLVTTFSFKAMAQPLGGKIGVNIEDAQSAVRGKTWVDVAKGAMPPNIPGQYGVITSIDSAGYPTTDAEVYFLNHQIVAEWTGFIDDPQARRINIGGTYKLSFKGQADLGGFENLTFSNKVYDASSNTTTVNVIVPNTARVVAITFANTRRTAQSPVNSGITDYKLISPGFPANTTQIFTDELVTALKPFRSIRFLNWAETNNNDPIFPQVTTWNDRHLPTNASFHKVGRKFGVPWEYAVLICNLTNKDLWINVPASATDDYVRQLALLIRDGNAFTNGKGLKPHLKIYIEHSNEIWNDGFTQKAYNRAATQAEIAAGNSPLNNDGETNLEELARRRHAKRTRELLQIFAQVFGNIEINNRIRGIYAHEISEPIQIRRVLEWANNTYGTPRNYFYAVAVNHYFTWYNAFGGTVPQILQSFRDQAITLGNETNTLVPIVRNFGLKLTAYEGGTISADFAPFGQPSVVGNAVLAERNSEMRNILKFALKDKWFDIDRDTIDSYQYFTLSSDYSRFGCYGLVEDFSNFNTPKYAAMTDLLGNGIELPDDWVTEDVGNTLSGTASFSNGTFTLRGGGNGIRTNKDDFRYVYKFLGVRQNFNLTARIVNLDNVSTNAEAGIMIRTSFADNTPQVSLAVTPLGNAVLRGRTVTGANLQTAVLAGVQAPYWIRLQKRGSLITAFVSADGITWNRSGSIKVALGGRVTAGLFVTSQSRNLISQGVFDNISAP